MHRDRIIHGLSVRRSLIKNLGKSRELVNHGPSRYVFAHTEIHTYLRRTRWHREGPLRSREFLLIGHFLSC